MKKLLKLTLSLLICGLMLLSGCGTSTPSLPDELAAAKNHIQQLGYCDLLVPSFFLSVTDENSADKKPAWLEDMSVRYGVQLNIISDSYSAQDHVYNSEASVKRYQVLNGEETFPGIVAVNAAQLNTAINQGIALPITFLYNYPVWTKLPADVKKMFYYNSEIYGIPASITQAPNARSISDSALELTGIPVTDLDSFKNFAIAYTQKTGKPAISSDGLTNLTDILNAFGLYAGEDAFTPFAYDPSEDSVIDFLTKDEAYEALLYLRELYSANALNINFDDSYDTALVDFMNGDSATYYGKYETYENCTAVASLNPENPQLLFNKNMFYILTKDTPNPKTTCLLLLDMLYGSEQNYLDCWLGSSDNYTKNADGTITIIKVRNVDGSYAIPAMPNLIQSIPNLFPYSQAGINYSQNGVVGKTVAGEGNVPEVFEPLVSQDKIRTAIDAWDLRYSEARFAYDLHDEITALYHACIKAAITDYSQNIGQIIQDYKDNMKKLGGNTVLDIMNSRQQTHAVYYYFN